MYKAILFDLDGTLLHLDQNELLLAYFKLIITEMAKIGSDIDTLKKANKAGIHAMIDNNGKYPSNSLAYWNAFENTVELDPIPFKELTDKFYRGDYVKIKPLTRVNPNARRAVDAARQKAEKVVLATNPMFPRVAQLERLSWAGFSESDFDLITDYDSDRFCKPNVEYYLDICERIGVAPAECLMVVNYTREHTFCGKLAGLDTFLVTDCLIEREGEVWDGKRGSFSELADFIESL